MPMTPAAPDADAHPLISVVIVSWNTAALLDSAIASVFAHRRAFAIEVIVVDNGSTDGSVEHVQQNWPQVRLIALAHNIGFGRANNLAAAEARGELLMLLNSDAECLADTIAPLVAELDREPGVGCVGPRHLNTDGSLQRSTNAFPTLTNDALELTELTAFAWVRGWLRPRFPWWTAHDLRVETGWVNGACMMIRREAFDAVGGFDPDFWFYAEEVDLCHRLVGAGWRIVFVPDALVVHHEGRSLDHDPTRRLRLRFAGHIRLYRKHYTPLKAFAFRCLVSATAAGRIGLLLALAALDRVGVRASEPLRTRIQSDRGSGPYRSWIAAWWAILLHRPCTAGPPARAERRLLHSKTDTGPGSHEHQV